jgi:formyltetrahydrofolate deformylase
MKRYAPASMQEARNLAVFLITCPDRKGIVATVSTFFFERGFNIVHCQQHTDRLESRFFMRILVDLDSAPCSRRELIDGFSSVAKPFSIQWSAHFCADPQRIGILATREPHCLHDLLSRADTGDLPNSKVALVISNHPELESVAARFSVPFFCCRIDRNDRRLQETEVVGLLRQHHVQLAVLARYMQVLSGEMLNEITIPVINIHHGFLPAFEGAGPYRRAWERGVKMIGATAHYVTPQLDGGPIIEQDVERVTHEDGVEALQRTGRDIESIVLARAVKAHLEHRVMVHANRAVVFSAGA